MIVFGENLGSGFPLILPAWKQVGWKAPLLANKIELDEVALTLYIYDKGSKSDNLNNGSPTGSQTAQTSDSGLTSGLTTKEMVFNLIVENPYITRAELAKAIGKALNTIQKCLNKLKTENRIHRVGPATLGGKWELVDM